MTNDYFNGYDGKSKRSPSNLEGYAKICIYCKGKFYAANKKRKYCCDHCKGCWHYENFQEEHKNDKIILDGNYSNFKVVRSLDQMGMKDVSERDLVIKGFDPEIAALFVLIDEKPAAVYNNYALYAVGEMFRIVKLSTWQK